MSFKKTFPFILVLAFASACNSPSTHPTITANPLDRGVDFAFSNDSAMTFEQESVHGRGAVTTQVHDGSVHVQRTGTVLGLSELALNFAPIQIQTTGLQMAFVDIEAVLEQPASMQITSTDPVGPILASGNAAFVVRFRVRWEDGSLSDVQEIALSTLRMNAVVRGGAALDLSLHAEQSAEFASWLGLFRLSNVVFDLYSGQPPQV